LNNNTPTLLNFFFFLLSHYYYGVIDHRRDEAIYTEEARAVETFDSPTMSRNHFG